MKKIILFLAITMSFVACESAKDALKDPITPGIVNGKLTGGLQSGAVELFKQSVRTVPSDQNVIISPLSIQYAFGMAANGASGQTLDEIMRVMGATPDQLKDVNSNLKGLKEALAGSSKDYNLGLANGVFYDISKFQMSSSYESTLNDVYQARLQQLNFNDVERSVESINAWVASNTEQRIRKVLDGIQDNEFMFLINALYMKASWDKPFPVETTFDSKFKTSDESERNIQLMNQRDYISYYGSDDEKAIVMPLSGGKLEALFVLPGKLNVISYINTLSKDHIEKMYANAVAKDLMLGLPKTELLLKYDLKAIMQDMGIRTPFSDAADFTKMGVADGKIVLTRALHDVFMKMDEKGIEGAAVTTIGVGTTSMPEYVGFGRPFVMIVRDKATGAYLFMGKIEDPTK